MLDAHLQQAMIEARWITFWVFQQNARARRFYERHGCRAIEFTDGAFNEEKTPDVLYEWHPQPRSPDL